MKSVPFESPAAFGIRQPRQCVRDGIQIGRDMQAVHLGVIRRVSDNPVPRRIDDALLRLQEPGRADTARQRHDRLTHFGRPVMRNPERFTLYRMFSEISRAAALSIRRAFSSGPQSTGSVPGSIAIISPTAALAAALSPQIR